MMRKHISQSNSVEAVSLLRQAALKTITEERPDYNGRNRVSTVFRNLGPFVTKENGAGNITDLMVWVKQFACDPLQLLSTLEPARRLPVTPVSVIYLASFVAGKTTAHEFESVFKSTVDIATKRAPEGASEIIRQHALLKLASVPGYEIDGLHLDPALEGLMPEKPKMVYFVYEQKSSLAKSEELTTRAVKHVGLLMPDANFIHWTPKGLEVIPYEDYVGNVHVQTKEAARLESVFLQDTIYTPSDKRSKVYEDDLVVISQVASTL
jgi:hypothetical protein